MGDEDAAQHATGSQCNKGGREEENRVAVGTAAQHETGYWTPKENEQDGAEPARCYDKPQCRNSERVDTALIVLAYRVGALPGEGLTGTDSRDCSS
jgi:hypothetical protein